jgi:hypothetical protein
LQLRDLTLHGGCLGGGLRIPRLGFFRKALALACLKLLLSALLRLFRRPLCGRRFSV